MTTVPPTEAELEEWKSRAERYDIAPDNYRRLIDEILRLRVLCGRSANDTHMTEDEWQTLQHELRAASEGRK